eukprot:CAMPEP_0184317844 /NCGR_PEP_ID=MMETSP1049-20130417/99071_1 /TAXON_ID=77928 /ORGANISM="Proteomonas sulcata, Strain CCMP704" /LENGTH=88 /DNA_ID=CAMNT_0026637387 /DNA_START=47 /DNA_END=310 /DNA_ORIENTATION=-
MEDDNRKTQEMKLKREKLAQEQKRIKGELELQKRMINEAVDNLKRTHKWVPPPGVDLNIDIDALQAQVSGQGRLKTQGSFKSMGSSRP